MDDYVAKPIDRQQLFHTLRHWLPSTPRTAAATPATPPTAAPGPDGAGELPALPGLNPADALRRLGLPYATYEKLLFRFAEAQPQTLSALRAALDAEDWETAQRHAHSMSGAAGNVSADDLRMRARALEQALKDGAGAYDPLYHALQSEAEKVCASIGGVQPPPSSAEVTPAVGQSVDHDQLMSALEDLTATLSEGDPEAVNAALEQLRVLGLDHAEPDVWTRLQALVDEFDFFTAAELVAVTWPQLHNHPQG